MPATTDLIGTYRKFYEDAPDEVGEGDAQIWYHRTQNMVTVFLKGAKGAKFNRSGSPDEAFVWAFFHPLVVTAGGESAKVPASSLVILPPGDSSVELAEDGDVWIGFTSLSKDLLDKCPNKGEYEPPLQNVAPVVPWPEPVGGYKLRVYNLNDTSAGKPHCYRHRTAMTNFGWPARSEPRDASALSPHTHDDFEQTSLLFAGTHVHHMRRAWSRNAGEWAPDEHVVLAAPAIAISKPPDIHTTQAVSNSGTVGLIDFFAPPRWDFSKVDGMVVNADEYPMPDEEPASYARGGSVYAANDPRSAIERRG